MARVVRLALALSLVLFLGGLLAGTGIAAAVEPYPHAFYGSVRYYSTTPDGPYTDAPVDTVVTAKVDGIEGSIITKYPGKYGSDEQGNSGPGVLKLLVQDSIPEEAVITFYVDGTLAEEVRVQYDYPTGPWVDVDPEWEATFDSGEVWGLDLIYYVYVPPTPTPTTPPGGGGGPVTEETPTPTPTVPPEETPTPTPTPTVTPTPTPPPPPFELNVSYLWDGVTSGGVTEDGVLTETIVATSEDGMVTLTLAQGTQVLSCEDGLVDVIEVQQVETPPTAPPDHHVIAAYDFEPCCTFDPPITLTIRYDPADLPDGFSEENLVIAYYDAGEWVLLDTDVNTAANTVTTDEINEFTVFAVLAAPAPPAVMGPAAWAGISVLGLLLLVILGLIIWSLLRRRAQKATPEAAP